MTPASGNCEVTLTSGSRVERWYAPGDVKAKLLDALGVDRAARLVPTDLNHVDEIHIGGHPATLSLLDQLELKPGQKILDAGCGIGGPARYAASAKGCMVVGIDIIAPLIAAATELTRLCGLEGLALFEVGDITNLSVAPGSFDAAYLLAVGMHIRDKVALLKRIHAALKPGALFGVFGPMGDAARMHYPLGWVATAADNHILSPEAYQAALWDAGFTIKALRDRREAALQDFRDLLSKLDEGQRKPHVGLEVLLGSEASRKTANVVRSMPSGACQPFEIIAVA